MTPEPGDEVRIMFTGTAEKIYHAGGHPSGHLVEMVPVRLPAGDLIFIPLVAGVNVTLEAGGR